MPTINRYIQINGFKLYWLFALLTLPNNSFSQNLFDYENSKKFAYHLYLNGEFQPAIIEFERVLQMSQNNEDTVLILISKASRMINKTENAINKILYYYPDTIFQNIQLSEEYVINLLDINRGQSAIFHIQNDKNFDSIQKKIYLIKSHLMLEEFKTAGIIYKTNASNVLINNSFNEVFFEIDNLKFKNPYFASGLSILLPGLGQVYSGYWKDGLYSLAIIMGLSYQSYSGFTKNGISSAYGWGFAAMTTTFYFSNIYGAFKAANKKNFIIKNNIKRKVEKINLHNY
jgi:hypothetical protein